MLEHLHIENLAVIESVDLDLGTGFTVLTGETGAGKSVLIHSLNLLMGDRVGKELVRSGCAKATVSGLFSGLSPEFCAQLSEFGFETDADELLIQRDLSAEGKTSVRINGRPATVSILKSLSSHLVNVHGQHDNRAFLDPATHLHYLDSFARNEDLYRAYTDVFHRLKDVLRRISKIDTDEQARMQKLDLLNYQLSEIDAAGLLPNEEDELQQRRTVLMNGEKIREALSRVYGDCFSDGAARDSLNAAASSLDSIASCDPRLAELASQLVSVCEMLDDLSFGVRDYMDEQSFDPSELDAVEDRLDLIHRLKRKYGASISEILSFRDRCAEELESLRNSEAVLEDLSREKEFLFKELKSAAAALTASRKTCAEVLEKELTAQLAFLDMPNTRFHVRIEPCSSFTPRGADDVEFLLSANLGEELRPLSKVASGGELSRIMLGMLTVLKVEDGAQTMIFDEIDTGVSGKAAEKIAMRLKQISRGKQVFAVTHLAQIAAYAEEHFLIEKSVTDQRTQTSVTPLDHSGRVEEIARIVGGLSPSPAAFAAAESLLKTGSEYGL